MDTSSHIRSRLSWAAVLVIAAAAAAAVMLVTAVVTGGASGEGIPDLVAVLCTGAIIVVLTGALTAWIVVARLSRQLEELARAANAATDGRSDTAINLARIDQHVAPLAHALNRLAQHSRQSIDALTHDRNQALAVLAGMVEGVIAIDAGQRVALVNDAAARMLGLSPPEVIGKLVWESVRVTAVREAAERALTLTDGAGEVVTEAKVPRGARELTVQIHAAPLKDARGGQAGVVLVLHDLTDLRKLEEMRRDFVANVSHELKTPLAAIRGLVETMADDPEMPRETQARFLVKTVAQTSRLSALVTDLLTLSRIESDPAAIERTPVDLRIVAQESLRLLQAAADAKGIKFRAEFAPAPTIVLGDEEALRQVIGNLLDNAVKYTPDKGEVFLRVKAEGANGHSRIVVEVQDTGIGIEPRHIGRIFERFYRVDKARSRELGGTGLGLAIVKHIVQALGGAVSVESTPGAGSTFKVSLPSAPAGALPVSKPAS